MENIKIAIVHDWLTGMRGGEKCLEVFCELFPEATLFTLVHDKGSVSPVIEAMDIKVSPLQKVPGIYGNYRKLVPFFPWAIESFDLTGFDLILSSSHCVAKGASIPEKALHICYCYTPVRYAWKFFDEYFGREKAIKKKTIAFFMNRLKRWDLETSRGVNEFIAISDTIRGRIKEYYGRVSDVIYPPVTIPDISVESTVDEGFYLIVSAFAPYKRVDLAVEAFNESGRRLVVIGNGQDNDMLRDMARDNIEFHGWVDDATLRRYYSTCKALIFPGEEDFGIVPVEAQAYGKPVVAYGKGGALETVIGPDDPGGRKPTGVFFREQTPEALNRAVASIESAGIVADKEEIRNNALRFSRDRFKREIKEYIENKWEDRG